MSRLVKEKQREAERESVPGQPMPTMLQRSLEETLQRHLAARFQTSRIPHSGLLRIRTPFQYPDGEAIDVYIEPASGTRDDYEVSDMGDAGRHLAMNAAEGKPTPRQLAAAAGICRSSGTTLDADIIKTGAAGKEQIPSAVLKVAQTACQSAALSLQPHITPEAAE